MPCTSFSLLYGFTFKIVSVRSLEGGSANNPKLLNLSKKGNNQGASLSMSKTSHEIFVLNVLTKL